MNISQLSIYPTFCLTILLAIVTALDKPNSLQQGQCSKVVVRYDGRVLKEFVAILLPVMLLSNF